MTVICKYHETSHIENNNNNNKDRVQQPVAMTHQTLSTTAKLLLFNSLVILVIISGQCQVQGARILGVFPIPSRSHVILGNRIMNELAARGHQVTFVTTISQNKKVENLKEIVVDEAMVQMSDDMKNRNLFEMDFNNPLAPFFSIYFVNVMGIKYTEIALSNEKVQQLLKSDVQFDLIFVENFCTEAFQALSHRYQAQLVLLSTVGSGSWTNHMVRNPAPSSYVPSMYLKYSPKMTFVQRLCNTGFNIVADLFQHFYIYRNHNALIQKHFPGAPDLYDLYKNISIILLNSHVSTAAPVPHVPNMIEIGGYHVEPPKKLPKELQEYLDNATEGVVYFSMGSNLKSVNLPEQKRKDILNVFAKLKQKVLWKWEEENLPGQPPNVKTLKWVPQQDVLAHPNVKLFVSHGGLLSTTEAVYHGVPIVGIPVFGDQKTNVEAAAKNGFAIYVPYTDLNEEKLSAALEEMLSNPKYAENAKKRSKILHDQPMKPLDTAMFWIEYVLRHKGAQHLQTAAVGKHWYEHMLLDVILFIAFEVIAVLVILYILGKLLFKRKKSIDHKKSD